MLGLLRPTVKTKLLSETVKEKEICASCFFFFVTPHTPTATVHDEVLG